MNRKSKRMCAALLAASLAALIFTGCGSASSTAMGYEQTAPAAAADSPAEYYYQADYYEAEYYETGEAAGSPTAGGGYTSGGVVEPTVTQPTDGRKIVMTASLQMQALEFDETNTHLRQALQRHGGYVSDSYLGQNGGWGGRYASYTLRVPAESYAAFVTDLQQAGNITELTESSEDITSRYVDTESRLRSLRTQEERLLQLMEQAGSLKDLLVVQEQLTEVQYEIEYYTANLRGMDDRVAYSTVYVSLYEVIEYTEPEVVPVTFLARLGTAFTAGWKQFAGVVGNVTVGLVRGMPVLLLLAVAAVVALVVWRRMKKKSAQPPKQEDEGGPDPEA